MMEILLIEDSPADANLIVDLCKIEYQDSHIHWSSSLSEGIAQVEDEKYDLIILDLDLPDSNGLDTLILFKKYTSLPIVILTGHKDEKLGIEAVKRGAQDYLIKGENTETLCRSLKYAIERHDHTCTRKTAKQFTKAITHLTKIVDNLNNFISNEP